MDEGLSKSNHEASTEILEHLRSKVREFGFGELDADIGASLIELGVDSGVPALEHYFAELFMYLKVFDEAGINRTHLELDRHLDGGWSWALLPGGDPELRVSSGNAYSNGIQDMAAYRSIGTLRQSLLDLMRDLGIDTPSDDGDNSPDGPKRRREI
ncbi:MAG: hypothetical protein QE265_09480 [Rhodoferax sp.]|nr:hypothetical protein [Rhodoferax sp.]